MVTFIFAKGWDRTGSNGFAYVWRFARNWKIMHFPKFNYFYYYDMSKRMFKVSGFFISGLLFLNKSSLKYYKINSIL